MIPIFADNPVKNKPIVTMIIVAISLIVFAYEFWLNQRGSLEAFIEIFALIPSSLSDKPYTAVSYLFIHASLIHIIPNLLFLWIFGSNVEDVMGSWGFAAFFILSGIATVFAQLYITGFDTTTAIIGCSGAVSAILGAYFTFFGASRILILFPTIFLAPPLVIMGVPFFWFFHLPAIAFLGAWFAWDVFQAFFMMTEGSDVALWTHISGFIIGIIVAFILQKTTNITAYYDELTAHRTQRKSRQRAKRNRKRRKEKKTINDNPLLKREFRTHDILK